MPIFGDYIIKLCFQSYVCQCKNVENTVFNMFHVYHQWKLIINKICLDIHNEMVAWQRTLQPAYGFERYEFLIKSWFVFVTFDMMSATPSESLVRYKNMFRNVLLLGYNQNLYPMRIN